MNMHKDNMTNEKNINLMDDNASSNLVVEEQIARNIVELLSDRAQRISSAEEQRLLAARNLAVNRLVDLQAQAISEHGINQSGHVLGWFGRHAGQYFEQHRIMSAALVVGAMLLTFFAVQQFGFNNNLENSDAFLLASDLPPEAYADKGFDAWLDTN